LATWREFASDAPGLAEFGAERFAQTSVAYLATVRKDGSPRIHPVTPIIGGGRLFLFMESTSPKGHDLRRDGRYALHSLVMDQNGTGGEFTVRGHASPTTDPAARRLAATAASYDPSDAYVLFELSVAEAASTLYQGGAPVRRRWHAC